MLLIVAVKMTGGENSPVIFFCNGEKSSLYNDDRGLQYRLIIIALPYHRFGILWRFGFRNL